MSMEGERLIYHALVKVETSRQDTTPERPSCVDSVVMHRKVQRHRTTVEQGSFGVRTRVLSKNSKSLCAVLSPALPICLVPNLLSLCVIYVFTNSLPQTRLVQKAPRDIQRFCVTGRSI